MLTREAFESATRGAPAHRSPEPDYVHPREWRRIMRDEARRLGWSRDEMRAELRARGEALDPWRVPLPVLRDDASAWFGFLPASTR